MSCVALNPMPDGTCRTIKSQYSFTAITNTTRTGSMGATMIAEKLSDDIAANERLKIYKVVDGYTEFIGKNKTKVRYKINMENGTYRIRKLTPTECFLLMGMEKSDVTKCENVGVSNSSLYKIAGNGLVTNCIQYIMEHLYKAIYDNSYETTDEKMIKDGFGV